MKSSKKSAFSGCIVWILSIGIISSCILPVFFMVGSITSSSQYAIKTTGNILCPTGTIPDGYSYSSTTPDKYGNRQPATVYELHCVDQNGNIAREDPIVYAFLWIGIFTLTGLIVSGIFAFLLAAPAGLLIGRLLNRGKRPNVEPE